MVDVGSGGRKAASGGKAQASKKSVATFSRSE
jgi:hypothetical protein